MILIAMIKAQGTLQEPLRASNVNMAMNSTLNFSKPCILKKKTGVR